jgi:hypothetical protein
MPSTPPLPSDSDDYAAPEKMRLNKAAWDAALTSIGVRLRAIEAQRADLQAVIDAGTSQGIAMISENLTPYIEDVQSQIAALVTEANTLAGQFASLLAGGVPADSIIETAARVFVTPAQKAAIGANTAAIASSVALDDVISYALALG